VSLASISPLEIDNFSSDVSTTISYVFKEKKSITLVRRFGKTFDLRTVIIRFIYIFGSARRRNLPSRSGYIEFDISPSIFGGYMPALSPILSCRQLQTRRPITVSDEGAAGTREPPFFGITYEYLDLILFAWKCAYRASDCVCSFHTTMCRKTNKIE